MDHSDGPSEEGVQALLRSVYSGSSYRDHLMLVQPRTVINRKSKARLFREQSERAQSPQWIKDLFGTAEPSPEDLETILASGTPAGHIIFECEVVDPPSARYRTVDVHIPPEQVLALLRLCRDAAREQRAQGMSGESLPRRWSSMATEITGE